MGGQRISGLSMPSATVYRHYMYSMHAFIQMQSRAHIHAGVAAVTAAVAAAAVVITGTLTSWPPPAPLRDPPHPPFGVLGVADRSVGPPRSLLSLDLRCRCELARRLRLRRAHGNGIT